MNLGNSADKEDLIIGLIERDQILVKEVDTVEGAWEKIKVSLDSGATDWVTNPNTAKAFKVKETAASREGQDYRAANGTIIKNYGEKLIDGITEAGNQVQVADANKTLGSASRMNQCRIEYVLDDTKEAVNKTIAEHAR